MTITFKALAALLSYPNDELVAALPEIRAMVRDERKLPRATREALVALADELATADLLDAQERYVALFDRGRATSLHLFEHVHGESRDRGQAMVDLQSLYERAGLVLAGRELPDYLPALLEFLSLQPIEVAQEMLGDSAHLVRAIGSAVAKRGSAYAAVFASTLALVGEKGLEAAPPPPEDKPLDDEWFEAPVVFGPAAGASCGVAPPAQSVMTFVPRAAAR